MELLKLMDYNVAYVCRCVLRLLLIIINNAYCIPTYVVWMIMIMPLKRCNPDLFWRIEGYFFHWLLAMVSMWSWSAGYDVVELGDDIRPCLHERTLVIANHQSTSDVPLLMASFNTKPHVLPNVMWIMDRIFKYTNFGIVSVLHQDFFIVSGRDNRGDSLRNLASHLRDSYLPRRRNWMVLFPEGGFLHKRRPTSQRFAAKNGLPHLRHVSLPRVGAFQTIMDQLTCAGPDPDPALVHHANNNTQLHHTAKSVELSWVLDITIAYPEGKPLDLLTLLTGYRQPCKTLFFYRLYPCAVVPRDHDAMASWMYDRFVEKEAMLELYYKTGVFPAEAFCTSPVRPQQVSQDCLRFAILHLFFITSTYFHFQMFSYLLHSMQSCCLPY